MRRKEDHPLQKVTLNLFEGDFDKLRLLHGKIGAGKVTRELVRAHIRKAEEAAAQTVKQLDLSVEEVIK